MRNKEDDRSSVWVEDAVRPTFWNIHHVEKSQRQGGLAAASATTDAHLQQREDRRRSGQWGGLALTQRRDITHPGDNWVADTCWAQLKIPHKVSAHSWLWFHRKCLVTTQGLHRHTSTIRSISKDILSHILKFTLPEHFNWSESWTKTKPRQSQNPLPCLF